MYMQYILNISRCFLLIINNRSPDTRSSLNFVGKDICYPVNFTTQTLVRRTPLKGDMSDLFISYLSAIY